LDWYSLQSFAWLESEGILRECYILKRPGDDDVQVTRVFRSLDAVCRPGRQAVQSLQEKREGRPTPWYLQAAGGVGLAAGVLATAVCVLSGRGT